MFSPYSPKSSPPASCRYRFAFGLFGKVSHRRGKRSLIALSFNAIMGAWADVEKFGVPSAAVGVCLVWIIRVSVSERSRELGAAARCREHGCSGSLPRIGTGSLPACCLSTAGRFTKTGRRGRPLFQGFPSPKIVHRTVFGFTPCRAHVVWGFRTLRSATRALPLDPASLCKGLTETLFIISTNSLFLKLTACLNKTLPQARRKACGEG